MFKYKKLVFALCLCTCFSAGVQGAGAGFYLENKEYRVNDPFVFCRYGYETSVAEMCWIPIPPYTGAWTYTDVCDPPNYYGRPWTERDYVALDRYLVICPQAKQPGNWHPKNGDATGEKTPTMH